MEKYLRFTFRTTVKNPHILNEIADFCKKKNIKSMNNAFEILLLSGLKYEKSLIKNEKSKKNLPMAAKTEDFISRLLNIFYDIYLENKGYDYILKHSGKDRSAMGKLVQFYKKKHPDANSEKTIHDMAVFFNQCFQIKDPWIMQNISPPIILLKLNSLNNYFKNGEPTRQKTTSTELAEIIHKHYSLE
jgi:hypothetical protein